jgi:hypothetical protein
MRKQQQHKIGRSRDSRQFGGAKSPYGRRICSSMKSAKMQPVLMGEVFAAA